MIERSTVPPFSESITVDLMLNGTATMSFVAAREVDVCVIVEVGVAPGEKRYSRSVKRPSGGTKERDLSRAHRCSLE